MRKSTLTLVFLMLVALAYGQKNVKDSLINAPMIQVNFSFHQPGNDLANRFGNSSAAGGTFMFKTKSNWLLGADFNYIFSENIKNKEELLSNLYTEDDAIIDGNGMFTTINFQQRGFYTSVMAGKLFPVLNPNPNSGFFLTGSIGLLQHKVHIDNPQNKAPQISGEYAKGYDRLTNGLAISEMFGYMYLSSNRILNFYLGVEYIQGWTQSRRDYNFNEMKKITKDRFDTLYGIRFGWIIPLYGKSSDGYHYY